MTQQNAADDLAYIRQIMDESRAFAEVGGDSFILWGSVTSIGMFATWAIATKLLPLSTGMIWPVWAMVTAIGFIADAVIIRRRRRQLAKHPSQAHIGGVWAALGISMLLLFFPGQYFGVIKPLAIPSIAASMLAVGVFMTGQLARITWLRNLSAAWWLASATMLAWPGVHTFLWYGLLLLALYVVPGFALNRMIKQAAT